MSVRYMNTSNLAKELKSQGDEPEYTKHFTIVSDSLRCFLLEFCPPPQERFIEESVIIEDDILTEKEKPLLPQVYVPFPVHKPIKISNTEYLVNHDIVGIQLSCYYAQAVLNNENIWENCGFLLKRYLFDTSISYLEGLRISGTPYFNVSSSFTVVINIVKTFTPETTPYFDVTAAHGYYYGLWEHFFRVFYLHAYSPDNVRQVSETRVILYELFCFFFDIEIMSSVAEKFDTGSDEGNKAMFLKEGDKVISFALKLCMENHEEDFVEFSKYLDIGWSQFSPPITCDIPRLDCCTEKTRVKDLRPRVQELIYKILEKYDMLDRVEKFRLQKFTNNSKRKSMSETESDSKRVKF